MCVCRRRWCTCTTHGDRTTGSVRIRHGTCGPAIIGNSRPRRAHWGIASLGPSQIHTHTSPIALAATGRGMAHPIVPNGYQMPGKGQAGVPGPNGGVAPIHSMVMIQTGDTGPPNPTSTSHTWEGAEGQGGQCTRPGPGPWGGVSFLAELHAVSQPATLKEEQAEKGKHGSR